MFKMKSHDPFHHLKHKLRSKERKVGNRLKFLSCTWRATYHWKVFNEGYNFALYLTSIEGLCTKLWAFQNRESLILGISGLSFESPETK
jgi:hypothetical protein